MRARLEEWDGTFVAAVEVPDGVIAIRYGERFFYWFNVPGKFVAIEVYSAPIEGSFVEP